MKKRLVGLIILSCLCLGFSGPNNDQLEVLEDILNSDLLPRGGTKAEKFLIKESKKVSKKKIQAQKKENQRFKRNLGRYDGYLDKAEEYCSDADFKKRSCANYLKNAKKMYESFPKAHLNDPEVMGLRKKENILKGRYQKQLETR